MGLHCPNADRGDDPPTPSSLHPRPGGIIRRGPWLPKVSIDSTLRLCSRGKQEEHTRCYCQRCCTASNAERQIRATDHFVATVKCFVRAVDSGLPA